MRHVTTALDLVGIACVAVAMVMLGARLHAPEAALALVGVLLLITSAMAVRRGGDRL